MQIVIDIHEEEYNDVKYFGTIVDEDRDYIAECILNGTVLPEQHGRLIDADKLFQQVGGIKPKSQIEYDDIGNFMNLITDAHTILEAREDGE